MHCLEMRINKILNEALYNLEFDKGEGVDAENLFIILKYLDYATVRDEDFVKKIVHLMITNGPLLSWDDMKLLIAAIEGIYLENSFKERYVSVDGETHRIKLDTKEHFLQLHRSLQRLFINKNN
jgi:hypothetical protein